MTTPNIPAPVDSVTIVSQPPGMINTPPIQQYFTAEQLEAARQQEKDKLYSKMQKTDEQLNQFKVTVEQLVADKTAREAEVETQRQATADAIQKEKDAKLSAQELIEAKEAELKKQQAEFQKNMDIKLAAMQKEQEFLRLQSFTRTKVAEEIAANTIMPELVEYISGNTEQEVEASILKAKEKTATIVKGATTLTGGNLNPGGVSPTGGPSGPLDMLGGPRELTAEDIAKMDMNQFAEYRKQSGLSRAGNGQGLFG